MKPVIGITPNLQPQGELSQSTLWDAYPECIVRAGGVPLILPCTADPETRRRQAELLDGLLLSGGSDVDPAGYGEEALDGFPVEDPVTPARDAYETALIQMMTAADKPVLGICRGHQILNVAFGGSLYQDLDMQLLRQPRLRHFQQLPWPDPAHRVDLEPNSLLASVMGDTVLAVNSLHHQAVREPGNGIRITGRSRDGVVESLERPQNRFCLGVQWHPELMVPNNPAWLRLFAALVDAAAPR